MGWTSYVAQYYKNGKIDRKKECDAYFLEGLNRGYYEIIKSTMVGNVYYAAVKSLKKRVNKTIIDIPTNEQEVFATVILTGVDKNLFFYKEISENMGPCYYDCPESILNLLSPTDNKYALRWRKDCKKQIKRKRFLKSCPIKTMIQFLDHNNQTITLIKQPPMYQFKTEWWQYWGKDSYYQKSHIPMNFVVLPVIKYPVIGVIYNWKGLSETNYLYSLEEIEEKDNALYNGLMNYSGNDQPIIDGFAAAANKSSVGILLRDKEELKDFLEFKWNFPEFHKEQDENWYCKLSNEDYYGSEKTNNLMNRALLEFKITSDKITSC